MTDSRDRVREMITVQEARDEVLRSCTRGPVERIALDAAVGRVLREDIVADLDIPPFDNSAMDGFAVSLADFEGQGVVLTIHEDLPAGTFPSKPVGRGACARIMTGAPVPNGTEAVVPIEWCESVGDVGETVTITKRPESGQHVRKRGSDIRRGDLAIAAPMRITPLTIGVLASLGYASVAATVRPVVSIVTTGDELVDASVTPTGGQIRNSNGPTLAAVTESLGARVGDVLVARDDYDETRRVFERALRADVVVISGGVSVGSHDFVKDVLDDLGFQSSFWRVRQRPGKPLTFGTIDGKPVFGLPGNPVSTAVCFRQYVAPAIRLMLGLEPGPKFLAARLEERIEKVGALHYFIPGRVDPDAEGRLCVWRSGKFGSHIFSSLAAANCLISIPEGPELVEPGTLVNVEVLQEPFSFGSTISS